MKKAYLIRTQGLGVLTDRVYLEPPTQADLDHAMAQELELHGLDDDGNVRERWISVQEIPLANGGGGVTDGSRMTGKLSEEAADLLRAGPQPGENTASTSLITMSGTGTVTNPGE